MKHILSRQDFLKSEINEGIVDNFVSGAKKVFNKVKGFFTFMIKKVKDFITIFDSNGNVLPVVSLQATIDHFSDSKNVQISTSKSMENAIKQNGGKCNNTTLSYNDKNETYDEVKKGSKEYNNFLRFTKILENRNINSENRLDEKRVSYLKAGEGLYINTITFSKLEKKLKQLIFERQNPDDDDDSPNRNLLVFGAPGIGKSTVPKKVIEEYNKNKSLKDSISLISVNCANIAPGDFMMPTIPQPKEILTYIQSHKDIPEFANFDKASEEEKKQLETYVAQQKISGSAPKSWLPCYKPSGNPDVDVILDAAANGCVTINANNPRKNKTTGSGGILLLDELFRADPAIFDQLMTFLLDRKFDDWVIGSKWTIIACSNRPVDSRNIKDTLTRGIDQANLDRYGEFVLLQPNVEDWKKFMRSIGLTGENEILFKFIFDPNKKDGDEFTNWHSSDEGDVDSYDENDPRTFPVTPRRWELVWRACKKYLKANDLNSILEIPMDELDDIVKYHFSPKFSNEFIDWMEKHTGNVNIKEIIKDPTNVFPKKSGKTDDVVIIRDLFEQFENLYKKKSSKDNDENIDESLSNIFIWFGIHMKDQLNLVKNDFFEKIDSVIPDLNLDDFPKTTDVLFAAWPSKEDFTEAGYIDDNKKMSEIKSLIKEYFPWRLDGDKILFVDDYEDEE